MRYWLANEPNFGRQAVYLDDANYPSQLPSAAGLQGYKADIALPLNMLQQFESIILWGKGATALLISTPFGFAVVIAIHTPK